MEVEYHMEGHSLEWIDSSESREEFEERYDEWASAYDKDLTEKWDYKLPAFIGDLFMKYVTNHQANILDAGAGTGLSGEYIVDKGYTNLSAIDMSQGMLDEAKSKNIYKSIDRMVLGEKLDFPDNHYDAVLSVGTMGHAPPESFDELVRITKPSGFIVFSLRVQFYIKPIFHQKLQSLQELAKWRQVERTDPIQGLPGESDNYYYGFVFQVL